MSDTPGRHGRTMEEEALAILRKAFRDEAEPRNLGSRISSRFDAIGLADDLPELRTPARPASFDR